jgi:ketosteroid isomerase-like protein
MTMEELEKKVKNLEDVEAIKQMHIKYILALNEQDFEAMLEYFTDDIVEEGLLPGLKHNGKAELSKFLRDMAAQQKRDKIWKGGQQLIHPIITVDGDTAKGSWTWFRLGMPHPFTSWLGRQVELFEPWEAKCDMEYRRVNGEWKISNYIFTMPWPSEQWPKEQRPKL